MKSRYCSSCGRILELDSNKCAICGTKQNNRHIVLLCTGIVIISILVAFAVCFKMNAQIEHLNERLSHKTEVHQIAEDNVAEWMKRYNELEDDYDELHDVAVYYREAYLKEKYGHLDWYDYLIASNKEQGPSFPAR